MVQRYLNLRDAGLNPRLAKVEELVDHSRGKIRADDGQAQQFGCEQLGRPAWPLACVFRGA